MLKIVHGIAGTGKTTYLYDKMKDVVNSGKKAILIVPEQYSFNSEKQLYRLLGARLSLSVEVLSFTRLCEMIFREYGGIVGRHIDVTGKNLLMSLCISEIRDALLVYGRQALSPAFIASMVEVVGELKTAGISSDELEKIAVNTSDKLCDISLIYSAFTELLSEGFTDTDDNLVRAYKILEGNRFFAETAVFVDGFMAFMGAEYKLIGRILESCEQLTIALTTDTLVEKEGGVGVFSAVKQTANRLIELADKQMIPIAPPVVLQKSHRISSNSIAFIAENYFKTEKTTLFSENNDCFLCKHESLYSEIVSVSTEICKLVREQGYHYHDIVVIARELDIYGQMIQTLFERFDIPFFIDSRHDIENHPLISCILTSLDAIRLEFDTDSMIKLLKSPVLNIDHTDASLVENYCYIWGVKGSVWMQPFCNHPNGMQELFTEFDQMNLDRMNLIREKVVQPLLVLKNSIGDQSAHSFAKGIYEYLIEIQSTEIIGIFAESLPIKEQKVFLDESVLIWDSLMNVLSLFGDMLKNAKFSIHRMVELFKLSIDTIDIGVIPQTLDQVVIGIADRIRPNYPKATFIIGANEGLFPKIVVDGGILTDIEKKELKLNGLELINTAEQKAIFEKYYVYFALTTPSERLYLSYPASNSKGSTLVASEIISKIEAMFQNFPLLSQLPFERIVNTKTAFHLLAEQFHQDNEVTATLIEYFSNADLNKLTKLNRSSMPVNFEIFNHDLATKMFGKHIRFSPSSVELFEKCPFAYFCEGGLKLKTRKKADFSPLESGSVIHLVLQVIVSKYGGKGLQYITDDLLKKEISEVIQSYLDKRIKDKKNLPSRIKYLFRRLITTTLKLVRQLAEEFAQSEFEPIAFEMQISKSSDVKPLELTVIGGGSLVVEGVVDRVDVFYRKGIKYVRVVDYKSGKRKFKLSDVYYGLNMQMLIYLFSIWQNGFGDGAECLPAGVLYMPSKDSVITAQRNTPDPIIALEHKRKLKMSGLILDDMDIIKGMEPDVDGVFIPVKLKKDGSFDARSAVASIADFGKMKEKMETILKSIAENLYHGQIEAVPVYGEDYQPCIYCEYKRICQHTEDDKIRKIDQIESEYTE